MNVGLATQTVDNLILGGGVGLIALLNVSDQFLTNSLLANATTYLNQDNVGARFSQGKGHCLADTAGTASDDGGPASQGEKRCYSCCHCDV